METTIIPEDIMTITVINEFLATLLQLATLYFLIRSLLFIWRVKSTQSAQSFYYIMFVILIATALTAYNITDYNYVAKRFPFNSIAYLGTATLIYLLCKSKKNENFTITNVKKQEHSYLENKSLEKIIDSKKGCKSREITVKTLDALKIGEIYSHKKIIIIRLTPPKISNLCFKFKVSMLKDGEFGLQHHAELKKFIQVDLGSIKNKHTGKVYKKGDVWEIMEGEPHNVVGLEFSELTTYLYNF